MQWLLLIHQLPPKPIYLRAKIGNRLARVGGLALKNSVYLLPFRDDCLEDFEWIAEEAVAGGGTAFICRTEFVLGANDEALVERFRAQSAEAYEGLKNEIAGVLQEARKRGTASAGNPLFRLKKRLLEISGIDFFDAPERKEAEAMLRALEDRLRGEDKGRRKATTKRSDLVGRTWVTRRAPKIDRLASAWLIRRFVDPGARFRFLSPDDDPREGEIGFDRVGGEFTHEGDRCTFETLLARAGVDAPGLREVAEIVHDVDLKDGKYGRPEALGVQQLIQGLCQSHPQDEDRLAQGLLFFDNLHASFLRGKTDSRRDRSVSKSHK